MEIRIIEFLLYIYSIQFKKVFEHICIHSKGNYREAITKEMEQLIQCVYIHNLQQVVVPEKLIILQGQDSYLFMLFYLLDGKAIIIAFLQPAEILVASKECQSPQVFQSPSPLSKTCYRYMVNSKIIQTWTYLKANRRIHGTLHT